MKKLLMFFLVCGQFLYCDAQNVTGVLSTSSGTVSFISQAPLEVIEASSDQLQGAIDIDENKFAFQVDIKSFLGFNSALQREHFNENYLESNDYPKAYFSGKFLEKINFDIPGDYNLRAKGHFFIHGIKQERIIEGKVVVTADDVNIKSFFSVPLSDHDISIPRIVNQKIAKQIDVIVDATLKRKQ